MEALGCVARLTDPCLTAGHSICWKQPSNEPEPNTHTHTHTPKGRQRCKPASSRAPHLLPARGAAYPGQNLFTRRELMQSTLHSKNKWWDLAQIQSLLTKQSHNATILSPSYLLNRLYTYIQYIHRIYSVTFSNYTIQQNVDAWLFILLQKGKKVYYRTVLYFIFIRLIYIICMVYWHKAIYSLENLNCLIYIIATYNLYNCTALYIKLYTCIHINTRIW